MWPIAGLAMVITVWPFYEPVLQNCFQKEINTGLGSPSGHKVINGILSMLRVVEGGSYLLGGHLARLVHIEYYICHRPDWRLGCCRAYTVP